MNFRLLQNGENTGIILNADTIFQEEGLKKVAKWVENNLEQFGLNEAHSCEVELDGFKIFINGDEDMVELKIQDVSNIAIKL